MRICTEDEAAAHPVSDNQICAVGAGTSAYKVSIDHIKIIAEL